MTEPKDYGRYYWCIEIEDAPTAGKGSRPRRVEVYAFADRAEVTPNGDLVLWQQRTDGRPDEITLAFPRGRWTFIYAASVLDGSAVSVQTWPGQISGR